MLRRVDSEAQVLLAALEVVVVESLRTGAESAREEVEEISDGMDVVHID